jgi:hypothetical protein
VVWEEGSREAPPYPDWADIMIPDADTIEYRPEDLCNRIATLTGSIMDFWNDGGWASQDAALLLDRSMLQWQTSLARSLGQWIRAESDGDLILAWVNLGALVEGQLKLFLSVYYEDYQADADAIQKRGTVVDPDECLLEALRQFFVRRVWDAGRNWNPYVEMVQRRRNAIHAFHRRDIGTFREWEDALRLHLSFLRDTGGGLPYPDEDFGGLREE